MVIWGDVIFILGLIDFTEAADHCAQTLYLQALGDTIQDVASIQRCLAHERLRLTVVCNDAVS